MAKVLPDGSVQADPFDIDSEALESQSQDLARRKNILATIGGIGDALASQNSFGNFFTGHMNAPSTTGSKMASTLSENMVDPMAQKAKQLAMAKSSFDAKDSARKNSFAESLQDDASPAAQAFKYSLKKSGLDIGDATAADLFAQGYSPAKIGEIKAQSQIQFENDMQKLEAQKKFERENRAAEQYQKHKDKLEEDAAKKSEGLSEGRKAVDKDFAKDYNEWNSGGKASVEKNIKRLEDAAKALDTDKSLTGPAVGLLPDVVRNFTNPKAVTTKQDVRAAAQGALKATLGAQFTEKEGERIMNQAYDEHLSAADNKKKIMAAVEELRAKKNSMEGRSRHFEQHGSLVGYTDPTPAPEPQKQYAADVMKYATDHSISVEEAQAIKDRRTSSTARK